MARVPDPPVPGDPKNITDSSFFIGFTKGSSNGANQQLWEIRWAFDLNFTNPYRVNWKPAGDTASGLRSNTTYYVQFRAYNVIGWSDWSRVVRVNTLLAPQTPPLAPDPEPTVGPTTPPYVPAPIPDPPPTIYLPGSTDPFYIDAQGQTGFHYLFHGPSAGGGTIQELQVGYGTDPYNVQYTTSVSLIGGNGDAFINGLTRNTTYYVWSRGRNEAGWGEWSRRFDVQTLAYVPSPPSPVGFDLLTQVSVRYTFKDEDNGGAEVLERQIGYGTDPSSVQQTVSSNGQTLITGLTPFGLWYFWSRVRNAAGWSQWSVRSEVRTKAGALVFAEGGWKEAIPYVKIDGVWHPAQPFVKRTGLWKTTI